MRETRLTADRGFEGRRAHLGEGHLGEGVNPASDVVGYACPEQLPATASTLSFQGWMHFTVRSVTADGATLRTVTDDVDPLPRRGLTFTVTLPFTGTHEVHAAVRSTSQEPDGARAVQISWIDPPRAFLTAVAEYLMIAGTGLTPAQLRAGGLSLRTAERAVTFGSAMMPHDEPEILNLRVRAHQHEGRLPGMTAADLASAIDADARHLVCRYDGRIVGYVRAILVDGDPARSQYLTLVGHQVPPWLWRTGFVEGGAAAVDPDFQRAGLFVPLVRHLVEVTVQSGFGYVLGACGDELLDMYHSMGFEMLETREVEPKPGWRFRSHLFHLDIDRLIRDRPRGKTIEAIAAAALFARSSDSLTARRRR